MLIFQKQYFILFFFLFIIEALIAAFLHDRFVRPYVGDFLVVILVYCFVKSFFNVPVFRTALGVLLFAYFVEFLQYLKLIKVLGLESSGLANTILGNSFEWIDLLAYTLGIFTLLCFEKIRLAQNIKRLRTIC